MDTLKILSVPHFERLMRFLREDIDDNFPSANYDTLTFTVNIAFVGMLYTLANNPLTQFVCFETGTLRTVEVSVNLKKKSFCGSRISNAGHHELALRHCFDSCI